MYSEHFVESYRKWQKKLQSGVEVVVVMIVMMMVEAMEVVTVEVMVMVVKVEMVAQEEVVEFVMLGKRFLLSL